MSRIKSRGSVIEKILERALRKAKIKYKKNCREVIGKPDFIVKKENIAIFCDSEFWHGYKWEKSKKELKTNRNFWIKKIEGNIRRDRLVNKLLKRQKWQVIRLWGKQIQSDTQKCINRILSIKNNGK